MEALERFWEWRFDITEQWFPGSIRDIEVLADIMLGPEYAKGKGFVAAYKTLKRLSLVRVRKY